MGSRAELLIAVLVTVKAAKAVMTVQPDRPGFFGHQVSIDEMGVI